MNFKRAKNWLKEICSWAAEARLVFLCCLVLFPALIFALLVCPSEQSIRTSGFVLQILGMVLAIRGLLKIRTYFRQPPLTRLFVKWLHRFPKWKKDTVIGLKTGNLVMVGEKVRVEVWTPDNTQDPMEKRIDGIIKNLERIKAEQRKISEQIDKQEKNQEKNQKEQEQSREKMENQIQSDLESLHTDDIIVSFIGLLWLTVGISMSTMSQELSKLFQ